MSAPSSPAPPPDPGGGSATGGPSAPPPAGPARPVIDKSDDPFPPSLQFRIRRFYYADGTSNPPLPTPQPTSPTTPPTAPPAGAHPETYGVHLQLVRYNARPRESDPTSDWQLRTGYTVWIDIDWMDETKRWREETWALTAPRAMYTDLSSIPAFARWIVSKSGPHLEASIIHDWLYLKWTDHRFGQKRFSDWVFADAVLVAGLRDLKDFHWFKRWMIAFAVQTAGRLVFFRKKVPLNLLLPQWERHLEDYPHNQPVPGKETAPKVPAGSWPALRARFYVWLVMLFSGAVAVLGLTKLWTTLAGWLTPGGLRGWDIFHKWNTVGPGAETAAVIGQGAGWVVLLFMGALGIGLTLAVLLWAWNRTKVGLRRALGR